MKRRVLELLMLSCMGLSTGMWNPPPAAPQSITWIYTKNLTKASAFLLDVVGLPIVFTGGATTWRGCEVHSAASAAFIGVCDIRAAPTSLDEAGVTIALVTANRSSVDQWHDRLGSAGPAVINVTTPRHSSEFNYAFNFYDADPASLGYYRFEVQTFEDPNWPQPKLSSTNEMLASQQVVHSASAIRLNIIPYTHS